jgi:hypothetical protein
VSGQRVRGLSVAPSRDAEVLETVWRGTQRAEVRYDLRLLYVRSRVGRIFDKHGRITASVKVIRRWPRWGRSIRFMRSTYFATVPVMEH